jgi:lysophospholipase L1-like esterase
MGAFVNDEETYPAQLESRLNAARRDGPSFEVINGGWSGTTSYYGAKTLADYVERFRPAVVVIGWGGLNDSLWVHFRETRLRLLSPVPRLLRSSAIYRLGECGLFRLWLYPEPVQRVSEDEYRGHLRTMHDVLRRRGVAAVFLTESLDPARNWSHVPVSQTHVAEKARIMAEEGNALSIPVVDVIPLVDRSVGGYLEDGIHWSLAGNGRIADAVAESIRIAKIENTLDVPGRHSSLENDRQRTFRGGESLSPQRRKHRDPWRAQRAANDGRSLPRVAESSILGAVATIQTYSMQ